MKLVSHYFVLLVYILNTLFFNTLVYSKQPEINNSNESIKLISINNIIIHDSHVEFNVTDKVNLEYGTKVILYDSDSGNYFSTVYLGNSVYQNEAENVFGILQLIPPEVFDNYNFEDSSESGYINFNDYQINKTNIDKPIIKNSSTIGLSNIITNSSINATVGGLTTTLYKKLIYDKEFRANTEKINNLQNEIHILKSNLDSSIQVAAAQTLLLLDRISSSIENGNIPGQINQVDNYKFSSTDEDLINELKFIRSNLLSNHSLLDRRQTAKKLGLNFTVAADKFSSINEPQIARVFKQYSEYMLDILVGIDPVSGPIRDIYEAFSNKNFITGQQLSEFERSFAVFGALTFGFGSKIKNIYRALDRVSEGFTFLKEISDISNKYFKGARAGLFNPVNYSNGNWDIFKRVYYYDSTDSDPRKIQSFLKNIFDTKPNKLFHYSKIIDETKNIKVATKYSEDAYQAIDQKSLDAYYSIKSGNNVVARQGGYPDAPLPSKAMTLGEYSQYWALDFSDLGKPAHNIKYGQYTDRIDFIEYGRVIDVEKIIVRPSPSGVYNGIVTPGGALEVVAPQGSIEKLYLRDLTNTVD